MKRTNLTRYTSLAYIAVVSLRYRLLRTSLTVIGVVIGIGSVVFLLSLGLGLQRLVTQQVVGTESIKTVDVTSQDAAVLPLTDKVSTKIAQYPNVAQAIDVYSYAGHATLASANTDTVIYGVDANYIKVVALQSATNQALAFDAPDDALVNTSLLKALGITDARKVIGQKITVTILPTADGTSSLNDFTNKTFTISGVATTAAGAELYLHNQAFINAGATSFSLLKVVADKDTSVPMVRKLIQGQGFSTTSPYDTLTQITQIFTYFNLILLGFGGIGMVIAVLGMFNTLTISLLERTKEVALLITLGASKRDVRELFLTEAVVLAGTGGIIGIAGAGLLGLGINTALASIAHERGLHGGVSTFYLPLWLIALTLLFAVGVGLLVAIYPVNKAGKIDPVDILRRG